MHTTADAPDRGKLVTLITGSNKRCRLLFAGDGRRSVYDKEPQRYAEDNNVDFTGLPACDIQRLQSVLNTAGTSGRRLMATRSRDFSATRPPLAARQTARRVQAVYDGTSLLVRRRTILPGGRDHAVSRCNCQT